MRRPEQHQDEITTNAPGRRLAARGRWVTAAVLLAVGAGLYLDLRGGVARLEHRLERVEGTARNIERAVQLYRFEQQGKQGLGLNALLEQVRFWAPQLGDATTLPAQVPIIERRLEEVLDALKALGPDAYDALERTFLQARPGVDLELRRWLMRAMTTLEPRRAEGFLGKVAAGLEVPVSPLCRLSAIDRLLELDRELAGKILREILLRESHRGLNPARMGAGAASRIPESGTTIGPWSGFFNFVDRFVASGHPDTESVLIMLLGRPEHDLATIQECVKALGRLRSERAVPHIERLFREPPGRFANPLFRNHCLQALADISGAKACDFFRRAQRREKDELVRKKLTELIKSLCG